MKIAFLGTPGFALPSLQMLLDAGHELALFTNPDRPKGRHGVPVPPPTKVLALANGIPVYQFERIRAPEGVAALRAFAPELMVTAAFGQLLSQENLDIPPYGCINVHASLLPKYRGAAPIQWAIIGGDTVTGVTTMYTALGLDTGDILLSRQTPIGPEETAGELFDRLACLGADLLKETIASLQAGTLVRTPQSEAEATRCTMIHKEDGKLSFAAQTAQQVHDRVRGTSPWPGAYALMEGGEPLKIWRTHMSGRLERGAAGECVIASPKTGLFVQAADGLVEILELQFPGGKRMTAAQALAGHALQGTILR
ncbi:MAG: methionyl-tRNA formyltransferase [Christensenellaceae bacterium]|jgi:methionyl-tRNA formyltransferase|nr:methionyl-tRNA formyltransferase [Christensenellaceae bacterium]